MEERSRAVFALLLCTSYIQLHKSLTWRKKDTHNMVHLQGRILALDKMFNVLEALLHSGFWRSWNQHLGLWALKFNNLPNDQQSACFVQDCVARISSCCRNSFFYFNIFFYFCTVKYILSKDGNKTKWAQLKCKSSFMTSTLKDWFLFCIPETTPPETELLQHQCLFLCFHCSFLGS